MSFKVSFIYTKCLKIGLYFECDYAECRYDECLHGEFVRKKFYKINYNWGIIITDATDE